MGWAPKMFPYIDQAPRYNAMEALYPNAISYLSPWRQEAAPHNGRSEIWGPVPGFSCPSSPLGERSPDITSFAWTSTQGALHYRGCSGTADDIANPADPTTHQYSRTGTIYPESKVRIADITDGTSNTMLLGESSSSRGWSSSMKVGWGGIQPWTWGMYWYVDNRRLTVDSKYIQFPANFRGNFNNNSTPFTSEHTGGVHILLCDGSGRFVSQNIDFGTYKAMATRAKGEVLGEF